PENGALSCGAQIVRIVLPGRPRTGEAERKESISGGAAYGRDSELRNRMAPAVARCLRSPRLEDLRPGRIVDTCSRPRSPAPCHSSDGFVAPPALAPVTPARSGSAFR